MQGAQLSRPPSITGSAAHSPTSPPHGIPPSPVTNGLSSSSVEDNVSICQPEKGVLLQSPLLSLGLTALSTTSSQTTLLLGFPRRKPATEGKVVMSGGPISAENGCKVSFGILSTDIYEITGKEIQTRSQGFCIRRRCTQGAWMQNAARRELSCLQLKGKENAR